MSISRNAPCPCGSGLKYKRCCGAPGADPLAAEAVAGMAEAGTPVSRNQTLRLALIFIAVSALIGVGVGTLLEETASGLAVGMGCLMASMIYLMARKPPSSTGRGGGTAIDFGLNQRGQRKGRRPQNRRQRRNN